MNVAQKKIQLYSELFPLKMLYFRRDYLNKFKIPFHRGSLFKYY